MIVPSAITLLERAMLGLRRPGGVGGVGVGGGVGVVTPAAAWVVVAAVMAAVSVVVGAVVAAGLAGDVPVFRSAVVIEWRQIAPSRRRGCH
jgi:hypothetical protein